MASPILSKEQIDGKVIFRFSHGFDHGGGIEQYLDDVNTVLSSKHRLHTIQLRLTTGIARQETLSLNGSTVTSYYVPSNVYKTEETSHSQNKKLLYRVTDLIRDRFLYHPLLNRSIFKKGLARRRAPRGICDPILILETVRRILSNHNVDLAVVHSFGTYDSQLAIRELKRAHIPVGLINHFSNVRFLNSAAREQVLQGNAIGAVSLSGMPRYIADRCIYVGDGIDTEFYQASLAHKIDDGYPGPRVLLPARLVRSKGHLDLIAAARIVKEAGIIVHLYFAGRPDSVQYKERIEASAKEAGIFGQIHFLGAQNRSELRAWYAGSILTALPTHHHEGLPRILLEAQAMMKPVVAYDVGGVNEGFINDESGILVPASNIAFLADALIRLTKNAKEQITMGSAGRIFVENKFSFQCLQRRHESFIQELLRHAP